MNRWSSARTFEADFSDPATTRLISATLLSTRLSRSNFAQVMSAMICARVCLPSTGRPDRSRYGSRSPQLRAAEVSRARGCVLARQILRRVRGRIRAASGAAAWRGPPSCRRFQRDRAQTKYEAQIGLHLYSRRCARLLQCSFSFSYARSCRGRIGACHSARFLGTHQFDRLVASARGDWNGRVRSVRGPQL